MLNASRQSTSRNVQKILTFSGLIARWLNSFSGHQQRFRLEKMSSLDFATTRLCMMSVETCHLRLTIQKVFVRVESTELSAFGVKGKFERTFDSRIYIFEKFNLEGSRLIAAVDAWVTKMGAVNFQEEPDRETIHTEKRRRYISPTCLAAPHDATVWDATKNGFGSAIVNPGVRLNKLHDR